jgi:predicted PurR-regulated permease PerM
MPPLATRPSAARITAWIIAAALLLLVLFLHLLASLFAGLLVFQLVHTLAPLLERRLPGQRARLTAVTILGAVVIALLTLSIVALIAFFRSDAGSGAALMEKLSEIIGQARAQLPLSLAIYLPDDAEDARAALTEFAQSHSHDLELAGRGALQGFVHVLIGMVLGALIALEEVLPRHELQPLARALQDRAGHLAEAFRRVVFAQVRISALNTIFTALFLLVALPLAGVRLPLAKTLVVFTFIVGLLPVVGNLISNTLITLIALSLSVYVAIAALVFLVVIHKLEYFLNARIVGGEIHARAWELLLAMLLMEAAFGLPGLVAAPIYYAYLKRELVEQNWV